MYGSGKSTVSLWELFIRCLENPGAVALITAPTLPLLKRTSIKTLLDEIIPPPLLKYFNKSEMEFKLINGTVIYAVASDDEVKLRSLNIGLAHIEEASGVKRSIYDQLLTRLRHHSVYNKVLLVSSNPDLTWIKDVLVDNERRVNPMHPEHEDYDPTIKHWIWPTAMNKYLPTDFIDRIKAGKPAWWVARFLEGSFEHSSGLVYPEYMSAIIEDIPDFAEKSKNWEKCVAADFGIRNPTAVLLGAIDPDENILYIYKMYYKADALLPEHAAAIKPMINEIPAGRLRFMVGDPSMKNRSADVVNGKSVQALYQDYNLYFSDGNNKMEAGIMRVNSYINRGRLKIFRTAGAELIKELQTYKYPELSMDDEKNLDENPIKYKDHACLVGDTLILTDQGEKAIRDVVVGDRVLTRKGYRKVYNAACTNFDQDIMQVKLSDGSHISGTADHKVWIKGKGFTTIDTLRYGDISATMNLCETSIVESERAHVYVVDVYSLGQRQDVYNIAVEGAHEYFANGVLVRNCDALRYMCMRLPENPEDMSTAAYESGDYNAKVRSNTDYDYEDDDDFDNAYGRDYLSYV